MIVRDETANLPACIGPTAGLFDELIVVDTGSVDDTVQVARELGARVHSFVWCDDFSAARNYAIEQASGDWIFWLDADDRIEPKQQAALAKLFGALAQDNRAYRMLTICPNENPAESPTIARHERLFRRSAEVRWQYRVHEQLLPSLRASGAEVVDVDIGIEHIGYLAPGAVARKLARNLGLLELELIEYPNDAFVLFNLGRSYAGLGRHLEALPHLERARTLIERGACMGPSWIDVFAELVRCLRANGQQDRAFDLCKLGVDHDPTAAVLIRLLADLHEKRGEAALAIEHFERLLETGVSGAPARFYTRQRLAQLHITQGQREAAIAHWREAIEERADYFPSVIGLIDALAGSARCEEAEQVIAQLERAAPQAPAGLVASGRLAMHQGDLTRAQLLLEQARAQAPTNVSVLEALSHVLLTEGRDLDAAERVLEAILAIDSQHESVQRNLTILRQARAASASTGQKLGNSGVQPGAR